MNDDIPRAVLSEQLQAHIKGRRVVAATFLTFEFDPGFFEQHVLPVLLNISLSHAPKVRLVQLEEALRRCAGQVAVFYDAARFVRGEAGSAHLDVRRIPVRVRQTNGVFHPKNVLLLVEQTAADENGHRARSLIVGALSANLTRSGWWENVEACHFVEIAEGEATMMREDLISLLRWLRQETPAADPHEPLQLIRSFLMRTEQRVRRFDEGGLHPQFFPGGDSFPDFLERCAGDFLRGAYLEIISPYVGAEDMSAPLKELITRFQPREVRVFLPRDRDGAVTCTEGLHRWVKALKDVSWGKMPEDVVRSGKARNRFVHAKVYRFFTQKPKREICFIGSVNLTRPAHQRGGNWESGLLVEVPCARMPEFWLKEETSRPTHFDPDTEADPAKAGGSPLILRYSWDRATLDAYWDAEKQSPALRLEDRGLQLGVVGPLLPAVWTEVDGALAAQIAALLKETSFVLVHGGGDEPGLVLIQEEGMTHKPSLLLNLTAAEILRYWSMLTPDQRSGFIEAKGLENVSDAECGELVNRVKIQWGSDTFFDRFAGVFHAFSCLETEVRAQLADGREKEAEFRLFGRKYDSLPTLLERVLGEAGASDDVERYVILLCARQLMQEVSRDFADFWRSHRRDVAELDGAIGRTTSIRGNLLAAGEQSMAGFLDWFDERFLKRAKPREVEV